MMYDVIIIGAGFAGYSAAIYTVRYDLKTLILASELGGVVNDAQEVENYPGFRKISGIELMQKFEHQARDLGAEVEIDEVTCILKKDKHYVIHATSEKVYEAKSVIIASGTKHKKLDIPGQEKFDGRGVHYCATCDAAFYRKKTVAVIGGGNSAALAADLLRGMCEKVYIIIRGKEMRAEAALLKPVLADPKVTLITDTCLTEYKGEKFLSSVTLNTAFNGSQELKIDGVFVEIGGIPSSAIAQKLGVEIGTSGEIIVDNLCRTKVPGIFAAGDVTNTVLRQGVVAAALGSIAATSAYNYVTGKNMGSHW
jgi:thioredoxin-disulfide reductase